MKSVRMTKQKKWILGALCHHPLSADELFLKLKKSGHRIDLTTIYRNLETLAAAGTIVETHFSDGVARFELSDGTHHHHVICGECGKVEDIAIDEKILIQATAKKTDFTISRHILEFFGVCRDCSKIHE